MFAKVLCKYIRRKKNLNKFLSNLNLGCAKKVHEKPDKLILSVLYRIWIYPQSEFVYLQGENRFIESICRTIFSIKELLEILTDANISNNLKRPFVRFLLWVYLNTASGMIDSGAGDLMHEE